MSPQGARRVEAGQPAPSTDEAPAPSIDEVVGASEAEPPRRIELLTYSLRKER